MENPPNVDRPKTTLRGGATRTSILENAAKLFAEKGFAGTALQDIADAMDLTRPALYHYFSSKEEVLATLVAETSLSTAERIERVRLRADISPSEKLRLVTSQLVRERTSAPERFRMLDRTESALPPDIGKKHRAARRAVLTELTAIIVEGVTAGEFRQTDERLAALSVLGMSNWVAWWYSPSHDEHAEPAEHIVTTLSDTAVAMLARPDHRLPKAPGRRAALAQLREDLDYLDRLLTDE
ncbi:TetR/AcrR family transcriptional regulator [Pseudarthrobacter raffinosi]|uniref:TetR/AcrR family transcriptional regulator n=1 Tax=Pseudarthrobacter raffinosi TaxID=2953651 RepID=UPI00208F1F98|nr:TetR/AcrR family transcriptional regulator [Pseudarthrobacter sp. MDT3-9]MCO4251240.1 TetR/AcrR family transcriptional regulator [Pseudarthrobacter sp. MDT3-9]